jgi:hypothetical protein
MEFEVVHSDLANQEIKPNRLQDEYVRLAGRENQKIVTTPRTEVRACPFCGKSDWQNPFRRLEFEYAACGNCWSLSVLQTPSQQRIDQFFEESEARHFWLDQIWNGTKSQRKAKILSPLLQWIEQGLMEHGKGDIGQKVVAEVLPTNWGLLETCRESGLKFQLKMVSPLFPAQKTPAALQAIPFSAMATTEEKFDAIGLFDAVARVENPTSLFTWAVEHLKPGGILFFTAILSSGLDVMVLGSQTDILMPPERLRAPSFEGLQEFIKGFPLEIVEMSTPGVLDLQNIKLAMSRGEIEVPAFLRYLLKRQDPALEWAFQEFLQTHQLSSQARLLLRKSSGRATRK